MGEREERRCERWAREGGYIGSVYMFDRLIYACQEVLVVQTRHTSPQPPWMTLHERHGHGRVGAQIHH